MQYDQVCECGHDLKCHLDDLDDASTATDCYFQYNCDCKQWRPRILFKAAHIDKRKFLHSARSLCCNHWLVTFNDEFQAWAHWQGMGQPPRDLRCRLCHQEIFSK